MLPSFLNVHIAGSAAKNLGVRLMEHHSNVEYLAYFYLVFLEANERFARKLYISHVQL